MSEPLLSDREDDRPSDGWHAVPSEDIFEYLDTSAEGISSEEAESRLQKYGPNEIQENEVISPFRIFVRQLRSVLIWILVAAAIVMVIVGHTIDAGLIIAIVVFITIFGFLQDYRAEQSIAALREMATRYALTRRDGEKTEIKTPTVVPGDVILIEAGDVVPADARIIEESNLSVDESALTGESLAVSKSVETLPPETPLAERKNHVYKDTVVERGSGVGVVLATGADTQIGGIATAIEEAEERKTPFEAEMNRLAKVIAIAVVTSVGIIAIAEMVIGDTPPLQVFLTAVGIAVSAVPEGLPAVVTLSLALGARRMASENALIRRLPVVEALGSVDVICTDKTGTLTEEEMTVQRVATAHSTYEVSGTGYDTDGDFTGETDPEVDEALDEMLRCSILCNNVDIGRREQAGDEERRYLGDPTEIALLVAAQKGGLDYQAIRDQFSRLAEIEFSSARKRMTTVHRDSDGEAIAYMKGAPEVVLERCEWEHRNGERVELTDRRREEIAELTDEFASDALRVMGFAMRETVETTDSFDDSIETGMIFLGLQGMLDPPRSEVPDAIAGCLAAGIEVVMITGDNARTAQAIADQIGLESPSVLTGRDLDDLSDQDMADVIGDITIFARTSPDHKTRILQSFQRVGHTVAMTGDGVNDAPAVKNADIGVAMGVRGTDVTEQASDMVLLDDNFATIHGAVREGRRIFDNVRKFVNYLLSGNGGEVTMIFTGSMAGFGLVITPIQILWINVVTDGIPALSMGIDPEADDIMERSPRPPEEGVITKRIVTSILGIALFMTICLLPLFVFNYRGYLIPGGIWKWDLGYSPSRELAQTMVFTGFVVMEIVRIQAIRFRYGLGLFSNRWLVVAVIVALLAQLLVLYTAPGQFLFDVEPLQIIHWVQIALAAGLFAILMGFFVKIQDRYFDRY